MDANERLAAALEAHTQALLENTAALKENTAETKNLNRLIDKLTENYRNGGHVGVLETTEKFEKIGKMVRESADRMEEASKRIANSSRY